MPILPCSETLLANGDSLFYGRQLMGIPTAGNKNRFCVFSTPLLDQVTAADPEMMCSPMVQVTVDSAIAGLGSAMILYGVEIQPNVLETQITINASNFEDAAMTGDYFCNITVIGHKAKSDG